MFKNGVKVPDTEIVILQRKKMNEEDCLNIPYDDAVNAEIRKRYTESQEFAILRQKDEKPEEYQAYYEYCEECKAYVRAKKGASDEI